MLTGWKIERMGIYKGIADRVIAGLQKKGIDAERIVKEMIDIPLSIRCRRANDIYRETGGDAILVLSIAMLPVPVQIGCLRMDGVYLYLTMHQ